MRPFARSAARAALHPTRLQLSSRPELLSSAFIGFVRPSVSTPGQGCKIQATAAPIRFYSAQPPPKDSEKPKEDNDATTSSTSAAESPPASHHELPSTTESRRSALNLKLSQIMDDIQVRAFNASQKLNDITGYSGIETIKAENAALEASLTNAQSRVRNARLAYKTSNTKRANTQREVTTLLARKDTWSPDDLERFTKLYRADHELEGEVAAAQEALTEAEADEQKLNQKLNSGILNRYHEEQIWSDRIRRASTWGTWGLMGMNFLLFLLLQFVAEPWKRKRLVKGVVAEEKVVLEEVRGELVALRALLEAEKETPLAVPAEAEVPPPAADEPVVVPLEDEPVFTRTWTELLADPATWKEAAIDLASDRVIDLRMKDASLLALEGAIAGATIVGAFAFFLVRT
ncbi:hypothetical protein S40288_00375 [Stachybotrys chartarum IBT 40288]|nr:hypothetical protein S40288_00375 [Stachybotrys chartarum IBT 40288]